MNAATRDHLPPRRLSAAGATARINNGVIALAVVVCILGLTDWLQARTDRARAEEAAAARWTVSLDACPERRPEDSDRIVMVIRSRADAGPIVEGCSRIAERQYLTQGAQP